MSDRRAREIVRSVEMECGVLSEEQYDLLTDRIATALRQMEAERNALKFAWRQVQPALDAAREREHALTARLARVEAVVNAARVFAEEVEEDHPAVDAVRLKTLNDALGTLAPE